MVQTFSKNMNKEATELLKKQVIFYFIVAFCPVIHNNYSKRHYLITLPVPILDEIRIQ